MKPWSLTSPRGRAARPLTTGATILLAALLASCSLSTPAPVKHMYLLEAAAPPAAAVQKLATVRIGVISVAAPFRGRALVYRRDDITYEADFYSEYFVAPAAMLGEATARALTAANVFRRVIPPGTAPDDAEYILDGFASELYGDVRAGGPAAAVVAVTYYLSTTGTATPKVVWSREYRQRVPVSGGGADALARAANTALSALLADLARDLAAAQLPRS